MIRIIAIAAAGIALAVAPALAEQRGSLHDDFQRRYDAMKAAMHAHDDAAMRAMLAPDFQSVDIRGQTETASQMIAEVDALPTDPQRTSVTTIDSMADDGAAATVEQHYEMHTTRVGADGASHAIALFARSTDTWVRSHDDWLLQRSVTHEMSLSRDGQVVQHLTQ